MADLGAIISDAAAALAAAGFDEPRRRARRLVAAALGRSAGEMFAHPDRTIIAAEADRVEAVLARALAHEPLTRILGTREFWGLEFALSPDTLDPRPESETIVEAVLARLEDRGRAHFFLDLGTGSGCLLLALLSEYRIARGVGVDQAEGAVQAARANARALGLAERARFVVADWGAALLGKFDSIVANPPYIATAVIAGLSPEVRDYDPLLALDGGADGLAAYRGIAADLPRLLPPGGLFAAEIGSGREREVAAILNTAGMAVEAIVPDLAGIPRCVVARRPPEAPAHIGQRGTKRLEKRVAPD